jgi:hypothetical protein
MAADGTRRLKRHVLSSGCILVQCVEREFAMYVAPVVVSGVCRSTRKAKSGRFGSGWSGAHARAVIDLRWCYAARLAEQVQHRR